MKMTPENSKMLPESCHCEKELKNVYPSKDVKNEKNASYKQFFSLPMLKASQEMILWVLKKCLGFPVRADLSR
jgi:hypothetical protein